MSHATLWPWATLLLLGAVHGLNPGMGWLFAVALGLQRQDRRAVWRALLPLAAGHALAIGAAVGLAWAAGVVLSPQPLRWVVAAALLGLGVVHLTRHRHVRWGGGGMLVGARDLAVWSFLMASAHGAGLMALPLVLGATQHAGHAAMLSGTLGHGASSGLVASGVHTAGYLAVTGLVAVVVYERMGLRLLRTAWLNVDLAWAVALVATAVLTPVL